LIESSVKNWVSGEYIRIDEKLGRQKDLKAVRGFLVKWQLKWAHWDQTGGQEVGDERFRLFHSELAVGCN